MERASLVLSDGWWRRRRGMRRHAGTTPRTRRRARTPGAQALQALRRYDTTYLALQRRSFSKLLETYLTRGDLTYLFTNYTLSASI